MSTLEYRWMPLVSPTDARRPLRIAIASSGLGHVRRGIESWANDTAAALYDFGHDVVLFQGGDATPDDPWRSVVRCLQRDEPSTRRYESIFRRLGGWRYGLGSRYEIEQTSFALNLWPLIRTEFDVVHVQDPHVALILDRLHRLGLSRPRVVLGHGTEEKPGRLRKLSALQHLAPCYQADWEPSRPRRQSAFAIPNFVDTSVFSPGDKMKARILLGLPIGRPIVLCVAAVKMHHKRVDSLLEEFATSRARLDFGAKLVIAGGREKETDAILVGAKCLGDDVRILIDFDRARIPDLYLAADVIAQASLHEMMPIAVLEALASGLPIACNDTPVLRWMVGDAGRLSDIRKPGALAAQIDYLVAPGGGDILCCVARQRAETMFSKDVVVPQMVDMYRTMTGTV